MADNDSIVISTDMLGCNYIHTSPYYNVWGNITGGNMTRTRYIELVKIAKELCDWLEKKGIKQDESCKVRKLTEELWEMKK